MTRKTLPLVALFLVLLGCLSSAGNSTLAAQNKLLIYMDNAQTDHLKAYGVAYFILSKGTEVGWLLN